MRYFGCEPYYIVKWFKKECDTRGEKGTLALGSHFGFIVNAKSTQANEAVIEDSVTGPSMASGLE